MFVNLLLLVCVIALITSIGIDIHRLPNDFDVETLDHQSVIIIIYYSVNLFERISY